MSAIREKRKGGPARRFMAIAGPRAPPNSLCSGLWPGRPRKGEALTPSRVPPPAVPVAGLQRPGADAEGGGFVNLAPSSFGSFLGGLEARLEGLRASGRAQRNLSAHPVAGAHPGSGEAAEPHSDRASPSAPAQRGAPGSASENKALRFQPKVKVHRGRFFLFFFFPLGIQER